MAGIFIGMALLIFALNTFFCIKQQNDLFIKSGENARFHIFSYRLCETPSSFIISRDDINKIHSAKNIETEINVQYNIITFAGKSHIENGEEIADDYVILFSDKTDRIFAEQTFVDIIPNLNQNNTINYSDIDFSMLSDASLYDDGDNNVHSCIAPINLYFDIAKESTFSKAKVNVICKNEDSFNEISALCKLLFKTNEYEFRADSDYYTFLSKASYANANVYRILFFAGLILLVVSFTTVCIFLCLVDERAFEIAVCKTVGASAFSILAEFFCELMIISVLPTMLSVIINCIAFINTVNITGIDISRLDIWSVVITFAIVLTINIVCIIPVWIKLYKLKPYELLVSEG